MSSTLSTFKPVVVVVAPISSTTARRSVSGRGMKRCRAEGAGRFALFVGAAVLANNLMIIGALLIKRSSRRRKAIR